MTTIAVAQRATVTAVLTALRPPAREEDDPAGVTRNLFERVHHLGLSSTGLGLHRNRGPHALLQLPAKLRDEALLVFADLDVTLGNQLFAVSRAHAQELHARIMSRRLWRFGAPLRRARLRPANGQ